MPGRGETGASGKFVVIEDTNIGLVVPGMGEGQGEASVDDPSMVGSTCKEKTKCF